MKEGTVWLIAPRIGNKSLWNNRGQDIQIAKKDIKDDLNSSGGFVREPTY